MTELLNEALKSDPITIVIIPLGIPGLGKSTLVNKTIPQLESMGFKVSSIESD